MGLPAQKPILGDINDPTTTTPGAFTPFVPKIQTPPDVKSSQPAIFRSAGGEIRTLAQKELWELGLKARQAGIKIDTPLEQIKVVSAPASTVATQPSSPAQAPTINQSSTVRNVLRPTTLAEKHDEMFKRDEKKYRLVYENKNFVDGDPNKNEVKRILGEREVKEEAPSSGWKPENLDAGYIRKYSQGIDQSLKRSIRKDEDVRKEAINYAIDRGVPLEEVKNETYTPTFKSFSPVEEKIPVVSATKSQTPNFAGPELKDTNDLPLNADPDGRIDPTLNKESPNQESGQDTTPETSPDNKKKRIEEASSVMGIRITKLPKSWKYFILPFAIGISTGQIEKAPIEQNLGFATVPGMTVEAEKPVAEIKSINEVHNTTAEEQIQSPEIKNFIKLIKERKNSELIISKVPSYFDVSNPATLENSSKILSMKVKDILNKLSFQEQTQKEISDLLKEVSLAFGALSGINDKELVSKPDESLSDTNDTVEEYLNRLRTKIS